MSTLLIDELYPGVVFEQAFTIPSSVNIAHIRPWIYLEGDLQDGELQLEVLDDTTVLKTETLTAGKINTIKSETYAHGFLRFDFKSLQLNVPQQVTEKEYKIRLQMINHTKDTANYIAVCRNWDLKIYDTYGSGVINNQAQNDSVEPAGMEIYVYRSI